ncbi:MAG TPA: nucleotidyltransferase domain-containing protein [Methanolinea sp.]|nr:nucleotidyltransferase domain-containing protein [Methanolinea sp.]HRS93597.1 nucleotidyltransferase domain-containing protein [Methanolinea sp.]
MKVQKPIRLRDFIEDGDGWLYAVSTYDNSERAGCTLRYVPDEEGDRVTGDGRRYRKVDFDEAFSLVAHKKPAYRDVFHRVPLSDIRRVLKPEEEIDRIAARDARVRRLLSLFSLPPGSIGCTGSFLCGLENEASDIDLVVYGDYWFRAVEILRDATGNGLLEPIDEAMWRRIYEKRKPELGFDEFLIHEKRKWNRGKIGTTYFDILYTRSYADALCVPHAKGRVLGRGTIEATVTDARFSHDSPAVYRVDHGEVSSVLSFTHTYSGQAREGEVIEARGVLEEHGGDVWLVVGTSREAKGEFIRSLTLLGED